MMLLLHCSNAGRSVLDLTSLSDVSMSEGREDSDSRQGQSHKAESQEADGQAQGMDDYDITYTNELVSAHMPAGYGESHLDACLAQLGGILEMIVLLSYTKFACCLSLLNAVAL